MFNPHSIARSVFGEGKKRIIVDTAEIESGIYECIAMDDFGNEFELRKFDSVEEAMTEHERLCTVYEKMASEVKFTKRMTALVEALKAACAEAVKVSNLEDDGGTSNFDSPALFLPKWKQAEVEACAKAAGLVAVDWKIGGTRWWRFSIPHPCGQGYNRTRMAEAMSESLKVSGYQSGMYYQMD